MPHTEALEFLRQLCFPITHRALATPQWKQLLPLENSGVPSRIPGWDVTLELLLPQMKCTLSQVTLRSLTGHSPRSVKYVSRGANRELRWPKAKAAQNLRPHLTCPTSWGGLDTVFLSTSGVFIRRSIRGLLSDTRARLASGVLQKSMRGRSARGGPWAFGVMVS